MMFQPELADWKNRQREECSRAVYHREMMMRKPGEMTHSRAPWTKRKPMNCAQSVKKAWMRTTIPQRNLQDS